MIIIELFISIIKFFCYCCLLVARFFVWIITARDCRHCKYGKLESGYSGFEWVCMKARAESETTYESYKKENEYRSDVIRKCFERRK